MYNKKALNDIEGHYSLALPHINGDILNEIYCYILKTVNDAASL